MSGENLELSIEQQAEVRAMLTMFADAKSVQLNKRKQHDFTEIDIDIIQESEPGTRISWNDLTPKTRRYTFVRETRAIFVPYILDKIPITLEKMTLLCEQIGMTVTTQKMNNTICSVSLAEPIRIFQIESQQASEKNVIITDIHYIV
tara:strand:- start:55 stop:495 length:441 start_codon:yes stop_codon:yes gene_type:complete